MTPPKTWVVCYGIGFDGTCKIGYSSRPARRISHYRLDLLAAVEPVTGDRVAASRLERARHEQFRALDIYRRYGGRCHEWFWLGPELVAHIAQLGGPSADLDRAAEGYARARRASL